MLLLIVLLQGSAVRVFFNQGHFAASRSYQDGVKAKQIQIVNFRVATDPRCPSASSRPAKHANGTPRGTHRTVRRYARP